MGILIIPEATLLEFKFRNHPEYWQALKQAIAQPDSSELWDKVEDERKEMEKN